MYQVKIYRESTKPSACIQPVRTQVLLTNCSSGTLTPLCSKKSISAAKIKLRFLGEVIIYGLRSGRGRGGGYSAKDSKI